MNNFNHLWRRFFKILIVLGLIGAANVYRSDFITAVTSLPAWLSQGIISGSAAGPGGSFDNVSSAFLSAVHTAWAQVPALQGETFGEPEHIFRDMPLASI